jgi:23S rRNA (uracil1939-C5)-methyltransferase
VHRKASRLFNGVILTENHRIRIEKLVYGADGLGHLLDGRAVFVPFTLPGEMVEIQIIQEGKKFARGKLKSVLESTPERVRPLCPHFGACGGCHYQHIAYDAQLQEKIAILQDQMERLGGFRNPLISGITASPDPWNYRNHLQFHPAPEGGLGFIDFAGKTVVPIQECHLPTNGINVLWPQIDLGSESGITRVTIREDSFDELMLVLEGTDALGPELSLDLPVSVCYRQPDGSSLTLAGQDQLTYQVLGRQLSLSPESFFQVNLGVAEKMVEYVLAHLPQELAFNTLELYAGAGLFSLFLAERSRELIAIESSPSACYDFANNLDIYDNVRLYEGPVEQLLPALMDDLPPLDLVLLDPPRAGLHPKARQSLEKLNSRQIIYLSCDPSTLARDLKHLCAAGYTLEDLHLFDMFPQTYHMETAAILQRG